MAATVIVWLLTSAALLAACRLMHLVNGGWVLLRHASERINEGWTGYKIIYSSVDEKPEVPCKLLQ